MGVIITVKVFAKQNGGPAGWTNRTDYIDLCYSYGSKTVVKTFSHVFVFSCHSVGLPICLHICVSLVFSSCYVQDKRLYSHIHDFVVDIY